MKSLHQILVLIKDAYNDDLIDEDCLCHTATYLKFKGIITREEEWLFTKEWIKTRSRKKRFYYGDDEVTDDNIQYGWKISDTESRNNWLSHRIGKYA